MSESAIHLHIDHLDEDGYVATSPDVPGPMAEGRSIVETVEIAQGLTRKIVESCLEYDNPVPEARVRAVGGGVDLVVPVTARYWAASRASSTVKSSGGFVIDETGATTSLGAILPIVQEILGGMR